MPKIKYIEILKSAWSLTWKNRRLWWFGLLIALGSPGLNYNLGKNEKIDSATFQKASDFASQHLPWIIAGAIIIFLLVIFLMLIGIIARAGLIKSIDSVSKNQPMSFKAGLKEGKKYLGKLFLLGLAIFFLIFASIVVLALPVTFLAISKSYIFAIFLGILALLILFPVMILAGFLYLFGNLYVVLADLSVWNALEKSYELFRKNLLSSIIMYLLFIPVSLALFMAGVAVFILLAVVFAAIGVAMYAAFSKIGAIITAAIGISIFLAIMMAVRSVFETFSQAAWYLFFLEIAKPKAEEMVVEAILEKKEEVLPVPDPVKTAEVEK
jgi:hypothetical protein